MGDELLTTKEVEDLIQLNRVTIYRLIREDDFPAVKIGGQWRFPLEAVKAWLAERGRSAKAEAPAESGEPGGQSKEPDLNALFNSPEVVSLLESFAASIGLSVVVLGPENETLVDCVTCRHPFCQLVHAAAGGEDVCMAARAKLNTASEDLYLLDCTSGLSYLQAPVQVNGNVRVRVVMGPLLKHDAPAQTVQQGLGSFAKQIGIDTRQLVRQFENVPDFTGEQVAILVDLLSRAVGAMVRVVATRSQAERRLREIAWLASEL